MRKFTPVRPDGPTGPPQGRKGRINFQSPRSAPRSTSISRLELIDLTAGQFRANYSNLLICEGNRKDMIDIYLVHLRQGVKT